MKIKLTNLNNNFIISFLLVFAFAINYNFFENIYIIFHNNYEARMQNQYGYCDKNGYGFLKKIQKTYDLKNNSKIINSNPQRYPNSGWVINQFKKPNNYKHIIFINSKSKPLNKSILYNEYNCYLAKND